MNNTNQSLINKLKQIPNEPGCYLWKDAYKNIIYVGKAKNLFKRTNSYFIGPKDLKTTKLVQNIDDVEWVIVSNPNEALILENNLIKKHRPKYNILLKDGTNYPYLLLTNKQPIDLVYTHNYDLKKGTYFGPIADLKHSKYEFYQIMCEVFGFRENKNIPPSRCLFNQFNQCFGFCEHNLYNKDYEQLKKRISEVFKGNIDPILKYLEYKELEAVDRLDFENATKYKQQQKSLSTLFVDGLVQLESNNSFDVIAYYWHNHYVVIIIFNYIEGKLLNKHVATFEIDQQQWYQTLSSYILQYYQTQKVCSQILVLLDQTELDALSAALNSKFKKPKSKQEKAIMQLCIQNAIDHYRVNINAFIQRQTNHAIALASLAKICKVDNLDLIECFDNSNINLQFPVAGMIGYEYGLYNPKLNRKYNLITQTKASDYHFMYEVIKRRYSNVLKNETKLPNLIVVDGGELQVSAATKALEELEIKIPIIGLKKNLKHQTNALVLADLTEIIFDDKKDPLYKFLAKMQDDVHNYAISFFRSKHTKSAFSSLLDQIKGIGSKRKALLLKNYGSVQAILNASDEQLALIIPKSIINDLKDQLQTIYNKKQKIKES
ncbi:excinuclease ABC subunit UvrC [Ureaplasma diversum]|uniref:excinuclease ABC subunit UvrC n=1 Tax=Ureaplasma diversum TaxID=42094 RepID=UPI000AFCD8B1|nr:excinuclease ABC subunit UvrC [Ureaplasma diversum]